MFFLTHLFTQVRLGQAQEEAQGGVYSETLQSRKTSTKDI